MKPVVTLCFIILAIFSCSSKKEQTTATAAEPRTIPPPQKEESRVFDYQPRTPVNGKLYGAIELGALGLNYFITEIDDQNRWVLKSSTYGRSNIIYGVNTTGEIVDRILAFRNEILKQGVSNENIHILASSSAIKASIVEEIKSQLSSRELDIKYINAKDEGQYALIATIPREFIDESFLVDIGSGNTKLSWVEGEDTLSIDIHGSKYFLGEAQDTTVFREVRDALLEVPKKNRNLCFMLGGIIYEFAKEEIEESGNRYYVLKTPNEYPTDNEKLRAANVIYNALFLEPTYSYIFDSQSNFSIGYLLNLEK